MLPTKRYVVWYSPARQEWDVRDTQRDALIVSFRDEWSARMAHMAMCIAWDDGAEAIKTGEVIL